MAAIFQTAGKWRAQIRRVGMKSVSAVFDSKEEAEAWAEVVDRKFLESRRRVHHPNDVQPTPKYGLSRLLSEDEIVAASEPARRITGVYFLIRTTEIIYIGSTNDVHRRILEHRQAGRDFDRYLVIEYATVEQSKTAEKQYLYKIRPSGNERIPKKRDSRPRYKSLASLQPRQRLIGDPAST